MAIHRKLTWTEIKSRERADRLSRMCNREFILISAEDRTRIWWDYLEGKFYRERTDNGPSSWAEAEFASSWATIC